MNKLLIITTLFIAQTSYEKLDREKFSVEYPKYWTMDTSGQNGTKFFVSSPKESESDVFLENVNLIIQDVSGQNLDLDAFVSLSEKQITSMIPESKIEESKRLVKNGKEYHRVVYKGKFQTFNLKLIQNYWVINNEAFVLTFTAEVDQFDNFSEKGERILKSFILK